MAVEIPKTSYSGKIKKVTLGKGSTSVTVGEETSYPFYLFEGEMSNVPKIAMEVWDCPPQDWPEAALEPFARVTDDPVTWARKCIDDYGAEMIALQLISTDPNGIDRGPEEAAAVVKKVSDNIDVPLIVWGTANHDKDTEVLRQVAELCQDKALILGPVEEGDHKKIGAAALAYHHTVIASTPIDINLAKQLNILLGNLGVSDEQLVMDPTVSGIGYGLEYAYSVMERMRMAGLTQQDEKLQFPIICNISKEVWKTKEVQLPTEEDPKLGDARKRGILTESMSAVVLLLAGADVLIMRHPEAIGLVRDMITELSVSPGG
ncbi:MAG: acetyl-CoA decarbonylase/synthase complex subunit delta [Dehalococcoidales bacterium]|jgi:acetyl-CoA decarbonylase/synthase complex subunit delta|nr:acetyl-CoA decarbonylase/synthase complex subunit delta [Dehalococcoidales bacterium]MDP6501296.1 acetyl-CoA decarbonylase/synthase complex subunit delta [Dehalococcoidales bacterium]MDP6632184.1 acetyl-CoA decarbonylase/synthase complex subunit delta [Dehalococcoidales bacterium]